MYYIERNTITDAMFLAGSVGEPATGETAWVPGTYAIGAEVVRPTLHRTYRCAVARAPTDTTPPENDENSWKEMRPTKRYLPFGPQVRANGKLVYLNYPLKDTAANIEYRMAQRYANAVAIFGAQGATWRVQVYNRPVTDGGVLVKEYTGRIKSAARSYWDYAYGQRYTTDRVLITDMPIYPNAEVRISIEGTGSQLRAVSQIEVGKLRYLPGVDLGGVLAGLTRDPRIFTTREQDANGTTGVLIYGNTYDMSGSISIKGRQEDSALTQLRHLMGKGVAYTPTLAPGFQQSLVFGVLKTAPTARDSLGRSTVQFQIEGLPT